MSWIFYSSSQCLFEINIPLYTCGFLFFKKFFRRLLAGRLICDILFFSRSHYTYIRLIVQSYLSIVLCVYGAWPCRKASIYTPKFPSKNWLHKKKKKFQELLIEFYKSGLLLKYANKSNHIFWETRSYRKRLL